MEETTVVTPGSVSISASFTRTADQDTHFTPVVYVRDSDDDEIIVENGSVTIDGINLLVDGYTGKYSNSTIRLLADSFYVMEVKLSDGSRYNSVILAPTYNYITPHVADTVAVGDTIKVPVTGKSNPVFNTEGLSVYYQGQIVPYEMRSDTMFIPPFIGSVDDAVTITLEIRASVKNALDFFPSFRSPTGYEFRVTNYRSVRILHGN